MVSIFIWSLNFIIFNQPMLDYRVDLLLQAWIMWLNVFHTLFTVLFLISIVLILIRKYSPYSQLYLVGFVTLQVVWNGCTITDTLNYFNSLGRFEFEPNGFIWDIGGDYSQWYRLAFLVFMPILYYNSFMTWSKASAHLDFGNYFRKKSSKH